MSELSRRGMILTGEIQKGSFNNILLKGEISPFLALFDIKGFRKVPIRDH